MGGACIVLLEAEKYIALVTHFGHTCVNIFHENSLVPAELEQCGENGRNNVSAGKDDEFSIREAGNGRVHACRAPESQYEEYSWHSVFRCPSHIRISQQM